MISKNNCDLWYSWQVCVQVATRQGRWGNMVKWSVCLFFTIFHSYKSWLIALACISVQYQTVQSLIPPPSQGTWTRFCKTNQMHLWFLLEILASRWNATWLCCRCILLLDHQLDLLWQLCLTNAGTRNSCSLTHHVHPFSRIRISFLRAPAHVSS